jgi:hypothetical protein
MRSVVLIHGLLRGMGREAPCEMIAMRDTSPDRTPAYCRCSVVEAPEDLPDGEYTVSFLGEAVRVRRQGGLWLPGEDPLRARHESPPPSLKY